MIDAAGVIAVVLVVGGRLLLPLLIFKFPLPGIIACLVLDAADQTIFQAVGGIDLAGYQSYDKALDVYYLSLAYVATMRNWTDATAFRIARFLFYYRLTGVTLFELNDGSDRTLLLLFPNTFEYFFIFYELVRTRWDPAAQSKRFWIAAAAFIWIVIKLPQEYWLHVAELDVTEQIGAHPVVAVCVFVALAVLLAYARRYVVAHARPADHPLRLRSDRLRDLGARRLRIAYRLQREGLFDLRRIEQIALVSLLWIIFVQFLPVEATVLDVVIAVVALVVADGAISAFFARRQQDAANAGMAFAGRASINVGLMFALRELVPGQRDFPELIAVFLLLIASLVLTVYERYRPVYEARPFSTKPKPAVLTKAVA